MEQDLGIQFTEAFQTIEASFADQEVSEALGIASGSPVLFVERIMYGRRRKPVELVQSSYRGDLYKYIVRLKNVKRKKGAVWIPQSG
jgi:GntR family transcriptional regulator